ncbi:MAG TPA: adventurous gliding motility protein CglE [Myxococcota bacterium]|nr:adventurous gliding motility protein CglE [Myxococcota bacterium]HNH46572.1 adventurous gliding motility protein CglE [Myxococcota bacterium]
MLLSLLLPLSPLTIAPAFAQDDGGYLEDEEGGERSTRRRSALNEGTVREIQRGVFGKANVGGLGYVGTFGTVTNAGIQVNMAVGQDFVDQEKLSMSWELMLSQGINGGADFYTQASAGCAPLGQGPAPCTQGDLRTYTIAALYEVSFYPVRRFGIGLRLGGGVLYSPLLVESTAWAEEVIPEYGGNDFGYHNAIHPAVLGGPTFEYYTKLAHFSVGADANFFFNVNHGMGWDASGFLKYTFGKNQKKKETRED